MNTKIGKSILIVSFFLLMVLVPTASFGQTTIQLPAQPASSWVKDFGEVNQPCGPPNPEEVNFINMSTPMGAGVRMTTQSNSVACCTCTRRSKVFPLGTVLNSDNASLQGWFQATRGPVDLYSVASMQIDLYRSGSRVGFNVYAAENRPNNNCALKLPETLLPSPGVFNIALSTISPHTQFDQIVIHLQGYGCGLAGNSIAVAALSLVNQSSSPISNTYKLEVGSVGLGTILNGAVPGRPGDIRLTVDSQGQIRTNRSSSVLRTLELRLTTSQPNLLLGGAVSGTLEDPNPRFGPSGAVNAWFNLFYGTVLGPLQSRRTDFSGKLPIILDGNQLRQALQSIPPGYPSGRMRLQITTSQGTIIFTLTITKI